MYNTTEIKEPQIVIIPGVPELKVIVQENLIELRQMYWMDKSIDTVFIHKNQITELINILKDFNNNVA
jgi:hypothetical protein